MKRILYTISLIVSLGAFAQVPIAEYNFSGDATDATVGANDGTVTGATLVADRFINANSAYSFDGVDDFISTNQTFADNQALSVSMWVFWDGTSGDQTAISWLDAALTNKQYFGVNGSGNIVFGDGFVTGTALTSGEWVHLVGTYDGSQSRTYINGIQVDVSSTGLTYQFDNLTIGRQGNNSAEYWDGAIDDVKIYNLALSSTQVATLYADEAPEGAFMTTWETTTASESITIPTTDTGYNYTVHWGDGTVESGLTGDAVHTYAAAGVYNVAITGDFPRIFFSSSTQIKSIEQWGDIAWTSFEGAFKSCFDLVINATDAPDLSGVTSLREMFLSCSNVNADLSNWDVSTITDMAGTFLNGTAFNGDISGWNTANVEFMNSMLENCPNFNVDISGWNTSSLTSTGYMFSGSTSFNQDLSSWDMSLVNFNINMFDGATGFDQSLAAWDISSMFDMSNMLNNSGMSKENYDATLIGWATLDTGAGETQIQSNVTVGADGLSFCGGAPARNTLINDFSWTFSGDADVCILADYSFSGNSDDESGNGYNGTASGATPSTDRFEIADNAYFFGGSSTMTFGSTENLDFGDAITVEAWINSSVYGASGAGEPEIISNGSGATGFDFKLSGGTSTEKGLKAEIFGTGVFLTIGSLELATWYHVAFTYQRNGSMILYLNGQEIGSTSAVDQPIAVSANQLVAGNAMNGSIDELTIYDRALAPNEIADAFSAGLETEPGDQPTNMVFDNNSGACFSYSFTPSITTDISGYLHVFNAVESPTFVPQDGVTYSADIGTPILGDNFISNVGNITSGNLCSQPTTTYFYKVYAFNGSGETINYLTETPLTAQITTLGNPTISSFTPTLANEGDQVTITGTNFSENVSNNLVTFNGVEATIIGTLTNESITVNVPVGTSSGPVTVTTAVGFATGTHLTATSSEDFIREDPHVSFTFSGNTLDNSGNGNDGTAIGGSGLTTDRFGNADAAFSFDGVDGAITTPDLAIQPTQLSMSTWFYFEDGAASGTHQLMEIQGAGALALFEGQFQGVLNLNGNFEVTTTAVTPGEWHFGTLTYDGTTMSTYLDGQLVQEIVNSDAIQYPNAETILQMGASFTNSYFNGWLDDAQLHGRALSASEITALYDDNPRATLMAIYNSTDGDNWANNDNWGTNADLSTWHGVGTSAGLINSLDLRSNNLNGTIPAEIGDLTTLNTLIFFNDAGLTGSIPSQVGNLTNLTYLAITLCDMTGTIPLELGNLTNVNTLLLSRNRLSGPVPDDIANLTNATVVQLHRNQLTAIPDFTGLPAGFSLRVDQNRIGFDDIITNLPIVGTGSSFIYGTQSVDSEETLFPAESASVTLTTSEVAAGTSYKWFLNGTEISGATTASYNFTFTSSLEGTYHAEMTNSNVPDLTITRDPYFVSDGVNAAPTAININNTVIKEGLPIGTVVATFSTTDADPIDNYTYELVSGEGDGFNAFFTISGDQLLTAVVLDQESTPSVSIRVRTTDSGSAQFEEFFSFLISPIQECNDDVFTAESGTFTDGSSIFDYESNFSCDWLIQIEAGKQIKLEFSDFNTEQDFDFVYVYDGENDSAPLLAQLSGNSLPESILSSSNSMLITFISDGLVTGAGWTANYSTLTPQAHYPFDGNASDVSGNGNHGTVNGSTTSATDRFGNADASLNFDGASSFVQAPSDLTNNAPFSIVAWVRWDGNTSDPTNIVSWLEASADTKTYLGTNTTTGEIRFGDTWTATGVNLPANEWLQIGATYDGSLAFLYLNGELVATSTSGRTFEFGVGDLYIGQQGEDPSPEYYGGRMDDLRIYSEQLSASQIKNLYDGGQTDLLAVYNFTGDLTDATANGFNATNASGGNAFSFSRVGFTNEAYDFDRTAGGALDLQNTDSYDFGDQITVTAWIRPDNYETSTVQLLSNVSSGNGFEFQLTSGDLSAEDLNTKRRLWGGIPGVSFGDLGEILLDRWTHVAFRYEVAVGVTLFINGVNQGTYSFVTGTENSVIGVSTIPILIGTDYDGLMDEVKIFDSALSDGEIYAEYDANLWPFHTLAFRGPEGGGSTTTDQGLDLDNEGDGYIKALELDFDGTYQFRATADNFEAFMGDNEGDGIAEPLGTQITLSPSFYAIGFDQYNFGYSITEILSVGFIGSSLTGDETGWIGDDVDLTHLGNRVYELKNITLFDGQWKLRINDAWSAIDWGSNSQDGNLNYFGENINVTAGQYNITADLLNNTYSIEEVGALVAQYNFDTGAAVDITGNGYDGVNMNDPQYSVDRFGSVAGTFEPSGNGTYVQITHNGDWDMQGAVTLNGWIRPNQFQSVEFGYTIFRDDNFGELDVSPNGSLFYHWNQNGSGDFGTLGTVAEDILVNRWNMVSLVIGSNDYVKLYIDGQLQKVSLNGGVTNVDSIQVTRHVGVGGAAYFGDSDQTEAGNRWFNGSIDDFRIYLGDELSAAELQEIYENEISGGLDERVAYFPFNAGGLLDESGNSYEGQFRDVDDNGTSAVTTTDRFGEANGAILFDNTGNSNHVFHERSINLSNDFTVNMWIRPESFAVGDELGDVLIANGLAGRFMTFESGILAYHYPSTNNVDFPSVATGTDVVSLSEWQMVTYSIDADNNIAIYHNGQQVITGDVSDQQVGTPDRFILAQNDEVSATDQRFYDGAMDDVTIYQRTLSAEEIADLFTEDVLIADYPFNGNANDESGNGNDATVTGASLTVDRFGNAESAFAFDGTNDFLTRTDANFLGGLSQGSISLWLNTNSLTKVQDVINTGSARFYISDAGFIITDLFTEGTDASMGTSLQANTWSHVVLTYDGSMARIYQNATLSVENASGGLINNASSLFIGSSGGTSNFMDGEIDDIKIYNHALSQAEIDALFNEGGSTANDIISFKIDEQVGDEVINANAHTVSIDMPYLTDRSSLTPTIGISDLASINPASGVAQDFSDVVTYTVTADDGSTQNWEVFLAVLANDEAILTSFSIDGNGGVIDTNDNSVAVEVANGTNFAALAAVFEVSEGAAVSVGGAAQESGTTTNDFTNPVTYRVTAADGINFTDWTVTVTEGAADAKEILSFTFPEQEGVTSIASIDETSGTVELDVIFGTTLSNLTASFALSGGANATIDGNQQTSGNTVNDFTNPVTYVVTASDNSTKNWVVTVEEAPNTATDITGFAISDQIGNTSIDPDNHAVEVSMPFGTDVTSLTPSFIELSSGATVNPDASTSRDFTNAVTYTVTAEDGVTTQEWMISVVVLPNNAPTALGLTNNTISENEAVGTVVGVLSTTDADAADTHSYSLISDPSSSFSIGGTDGNELQSAVVFDFESGTTSYAITIQTNDGNGGTFNQDFAIDIVDIVNENTNSIFSNLVTPSSQSGEGEAIDVSATVVDDQGLSRVEIYHRKIGVTDYTVESMNDDGGDAYSFSISDANLSALGVQYFLRAVDMLGNEVDTDIFNAVKVVSETTDVLPSSVRAGTQQSDYRIIAFPYQSANTSQLVEDLGNYDKANWRLLRYTGSSYSDLGSNSSLSPGVGYWFIYKDASVTSIDVGGESVTVNENGIFTVNLSAGYNLIGNPFKGSLNWGDVVNHNIAEGVMVAGDISSDNTGVLDGWNGNFADRSSISAFEGAFVLMENAVSNFEIPISAVTGRVENSVRMPQESFIDDAEWDLRFFFKAPSYSYSMGGVGMHPDANDEDDYYDKDLLPRFFTFLDMQFADGNTRSVKQSDHFKEWTFQIPNNLPESEVNLTWDVPVSSRKTILLVDGASNKVYDLSKTRSINLPNNPTATHRIYYGDEATIWDNIDLPFDVLYSVYPNPVENQFTLEVYAAENKNVEVELISLSGRATSLGQISLQKGLSSRKIDLTQNDVKNGIYFIKVDGEVMTKIFKK